MGVPMRAEQEPASWAPASTQPSWLPLIQLSLTGHTTALWVDHFDLLFNCNQLAFPQRAEDRKGRVRTHPGEGTCELPTSGSSSDVTTPRECLTLPHLPAPKKRGGASIHQALTIYPNVLTTVSLPVQAAVVECKEPSPASLYLERITGPDIQLVRKKIVMKLAFDENALGSSPH